MSRATVEVADVFRRFGPQYRIAHKLPFQHSRMMGAIESCRTAALGGHVDRCNHCRHQRISYNSCRNRHCPKCQNAARGEWVEKRKAELLPIDYYHLVFTIPSELNALALQNKEAVYKLLFDASAETPAHNRFRSETSGCQDRLLFRPAHLGTKSAASSSRALRGYWRRSGTRSRFLDFLPAWVLFECAGIIAALSTLVPGRHATAA